MKRFFDLLVYEKRNHIESNVKHIHLQRRPIAIQDMYSEMSAKSASESLLAVKH